MIRLTQHQPNPSQSNPINDQCFFVCPWVSSLLEYRKSPPPCGRYVRSAGAADRSPVSTMTLCHRWHAKSVLNGTGSAHLPFFLQASWRIFCLRVRVLDTLDRNRRCWRINPVGRSHPRDALHADVPSLPSPWLRYILYIYIYISALFVDCITIF